MDDIRRLEDEAKAELDKVSEGLLNTFTGHL